MQSDHAGTLILGAPRSGTTLLRRLLDAHPAICCPGETNLFTACGRFLRQSRIAEDVPVGVLSGLAMAGVSESVTLDHLRTMAFDLMRQVCRWHSADVWVSKTPDDVFYIDEIEQLCGDQCRFLCLFRHGADVVPSLEELCQKNQVYLPEIHNYIRRYPAPYEAFAHLWCETTERLLRLMRERPENTFRLDYEQLVAEPQQTMRDVFSFLQVSPEPWNFEQALRRRDNLGLGDWKTYQRKTVDAASVGRWRALSANTQHRLGRIMNGVLRDAGYEPLPTGRQREADEAQRRYQLGLLLQGLADETRSGAEAMTDDTAL